LAKASFAKDFAIAKNAPAFPVGVIAFVRLLWIPLQSVAEAIYRDLQRTYPLGNLENPDIECPLVVPRGLRRFDVDVSQYRNRKSYLECHSGVNG